MKTIVSLIICLALALAAGACVAEGLSKVDPSAPVTGPINVSISADGSPVADVLTSLAGQSRQKILVEASVKGKVTLSLKDASLDSALTAVCKPANLVWRKVYIDPKSELLDKPDRFASTLRLMAGLSFPDLVVAGASTNKIGVHCEKAQGVVDAQDKIVKDLGLEPVYLVSNDAAVAAKEAAKDTPAAKYKEAAQKQMDDFMKMSPEDREQSLLQNMDLMNNVSPEYMGAVYQTLANVDPATMQKIQARQTDMLLSMSPESRRAMMKFTMQAAKNINPEVMKLLAEDAKALAEEMKNQQPAP